MARTHLLDNEVDGNNNPSWNANQGDKSLLKCTSGFSEYLG